MFARLLLLFCLLLNAPAFARTVPVPQPLPPPMPRLMESPGAEKPIQLQSLTVRSELSGSLAETTVRMVFFNPNNRQLEGNLQFPLQDGQQITAFALDINGRMRPAVPVEKARGRQIFEAIERRKVDPGLLEVTQGNNFKLRVYPIAARGTRTVELRYSEALARDGKNWIYSLPLGYGERLRDVDLDIRVRGAAAAPVFTAVPVALGDLAFTRQGDDYRAFLRRDELSAPGSALTLQVPARVQAQAYVQERDGERYFLAEIPVSARRYARPLPKVVGLLWDSSGSGAARQTGAELAELNRYFRALGNAEVRLTRLRDTAEATETFRVVNGNWDALRNALQSTLYDGASALADWKPQADVEEYLLVSDGLANYGPTRFPVLNGKQRLYALSSALSADMPRLAALAEKNGGRAIQVRADKPGQAAQLLLTEGVRVNTIRASGAAEVLADANDTQSGLLRIAGKLNQANAQVTVVTTQEGRTQETHIDIKSTAPAHPLAAQLWAGYKLRAMDADYEFNRASIRRIGTQFAIPTRETSLLVLEQLNDYVRYDVPPPGELLAEYEAIKSSRWREQQVSRDQHLEQVVREFEQKVAWWEKRYPKDGMKKPAPPQAAEMRREAGFLVSESRADKVLAQAAPAPAAAPAKRMSNLVGARALEADAGADMRSTGKLGFAEAESQPSVGIALKRWTPDAPYIARMKAADGADLYRVYLDEKPSYANSSAFFLDAADMLLEKGQRDLALRVLSNLAEMDLENRHVLRILGYRLMQANAPELAIPVFEKVKRLAEEEPQSFRDLGLAYAAAKQYQAAIDNLNEVVIRPWDGRFAEISTIALAELNAVVATSGANVDTSRVDPRLLKNLPLDLRAVLTWDADNSDMDLWITDPNGEKCYFGNRITYQGGRMSRDFTGGYGPEEFSLRQAKPGKYKVEVNFFGSSQQIVAGATTLQVRLTSGFGTGGAHDQTMMLRLKGSGNTVYVGEFEVKANNK